ncbi:MAG: exodeoxyribonuclease VII large subunit [Phycisphaerae bacterium]
MSGGLFDYPLFDAPDSPRARRGEMGKKPLDQKSPTAVKSVAPPSALAATTRTLSLSPVPLTDTGMSDISTPPGEPPRTATELSPIHTVSEVNGLIGRVLQNQLPPVLRVRGEISNFNIYSKGHAFFKLKDQYSELPCMMWRNDLEKLRFRPADGLAVMAEGAVKLYEAQGRLQLYVSHMIPQGAGELELAFRQLCDKLRAEGLFDAARKRPLPSVPQHLVVITSPTGDVFHDVVITAYRRFPNLHIMLFPVQVQGAPAARDIVRAIEMVNAHAAAIGGVDVILLVRGGGSLEDLWAFNEESVARAIVRSVIPVATGIGHEPDVTIADLAADLRGPTPTGVAAMVIPEQAVLHRQVSVLLDLVTRNIAIRCRDGRNTVTIRQSDITDAVRRMLRAAVQNTDLADRRIAAIEPRHAIAQGWRRLDHAADRLHQQIRERVHVADDRLTRSATRLQRYSPHLRQAEYNVILTSLQAQLAIALQHYYKVHEQRLLELKKQLELAGPLQVLQRGFTITTDVRGAVVKTATQVRSGETIQTRTASGSLNSVVSEVYGIAPP